MAQVAGTTSNAKAALKNASNDEDPNAKLFRQMEKHLSLIAGWMTFFGILGILGLVFGLIGFIASNH